MQCEFLGLTLKAHLILPSGYHTHLARQNSPLTVMQVCPLNTFLASFIISSSRICQRTQKHPTRTDRIRSYLLILEKLEALSALQKQGMGSEDRELAHCHEHWTIRLGLRPNPFLCTTLKNLLDYSLNDVQLHLL